MFDALFLQFYLLKVIILTTNRIQLPKSVQDATGFSVAILTDVSRNTIQADK
jgi:hypothetical protein